MSGKYETHSPAPANTPCGFPRCASGSKAVHVMQKDYPVGAAGTALCAYHSPFDVPSPIDRPRFEYASGVEDVEMFETEGYTMDQNSITVEVDTHIKGRLIELALPLGLNMARLTREQAVELIHALQGAVGAVTQSLV